MKNKSLDAKVIDIVRRIKSLSVMKTSLDKLISDNQSSVPVGPATAAAPAPKREEEKIEKVVVVNRMAAGNKKRAGVNVLTFLSTARAGLTIRQTRRSA